MSATAPGAGPPAPDAVEEGAAGPAQPEVTVLLVTAGRPGMLAAALPRALEQVAVRAEVWVIDNAGGAETEAALERHEPHRVVRFAGRRTYAEANNAALALGTAPCVLFLNDDCFLEPGFLAAAIEEMEPHGVAAVQGRLLRALGPGEPLAEVDSVGLVVNRAHRSSVAGHGLPDGAFEEPAPVFGPDGAAALWRREALDDVAIGPEVLDPDLVSYGTDVDLAWRVRAAGWRCAYCPGAVAYHVRAYSPSTRASVAPALRRLQFRNRYLMMLKNETAGTFFRHLPWIAAFEVLALGHVLLRERFLLRGYAEALRLAPRALGRRRLVARRAATGQLAPALAGLEPRP